VTFSFDSLRRFPDVEAPNLFAVDASDRLILDEAAEALAASAPGEVVVIGDHYGAITLAAAATHGLRDIRVHIDPLSGERALANNAGELAPAFTVLPLDASLLSGARVVLLQLPRSLDELDEIAGLIAANAHPEVRLYAGGMIKHLSLGMNEVLGRHFSAVRAGLARQKARVLTVSGPIQAASEWPRREFQRELDLWVCANGGVFAGTKLDIGTRFLLSVLDQATPDAVTAIDLGSGSGIVAAVLAKSRPGLAVLATDQSAAAVASSEATALANGLGDRVRVVRDAGLESQPDASADLVVLNPPFHVGAVVHTGLAHRLFADAARVLRPGGELWTVYNSHLGYRGALKELVGETRQIAKNTKFTVTASIAREQSSR
jgi:16S rRNA (guanine1207-N2)-methyltransferase